MHSQKLNIISLASLSLFVFISSKECLAQNWQETQKVVANDREDFAEFGVAVSIDDSIAVVGAYLEDKDEFSSNYIANTGAAYVYKLDVGGNWVFHQKLDASDRALGDRFGASVSVSGDYIVIGAIEEDEDEFGSNTLNNAGSAYIFKKDGSGNFIEHQKIVASDRDASDYYGISVRIDGIHIVVGAFQQNYDEFGGNLMLDPGAAYIYELDTVTSIWSQSQKIVASDRNSYDWFGYAVDISGNYIAVGAFQQNNDENGLNNLSDAGAAYIFEKDTVSGIWSEVSKIDASDRQEDDNFGGILSIQGDNLVIGAKHQDYDDQGLNNISGAGAAYYFHRDTLGNWQEVQKLVAPVRAVGDNFGYDVSIYGNYIAVGANKEDHDENESNPLTNPGAVYIFELNGSGVWYMKNKVVASDRENFDEYGVVAIGEHHGIVGAKDEDHDEMGNNNMSSAGSVYMLNNDCPVIITNESYSICQGDSILLAGQYRYSAGYYVDTLASSSCSDSLISNHLSIVPNSASTNDTTICTDDSLFVQGAYQNTPGTYYDTLTNIMGCDSVIQTNLFIKTLYSLSQTIDICDGDSILLGGVYQTNPGIYTDTLSSTVCYDSVMTTTLNVNSVNVNVTLSGFDLIAQASPASYQWVDCDDGYQPISGEMSQTYSPVSNGNYAVIVDQNGCSDTSTCYLIEGIGLSEFVLTDPLVSIFPNPASDKINLRFNKTHSHVIVSVFDPVGQLVFFNEYDNITEVEMELSGPTGVYIIKIQVAQIEPAIYKLIKK